MKRIELAYKALQIGLSLLLLFVSTLSLAGFFSSLDQVCELLSRPSHWIRSLACSSRIVALKRTATSLPFLLENFIDLGRVE